VANASSMVTGACRCRQRYRAKFATVKTALRMSHLPWPAWVTQHK